MVVAQPSGVRLAFTTAASTVELTGRISRTLFPDARLSTIKSRFRLGTAKDADRFVEGFRLAGMSE